MKQNVLDRFSKTGRLRSRLEEVLEQVSKRDLPRMDAGDLIGRHVVANLLALPQRSPEENLLLFEAQRERAVLYQESSGATALEAAEALTEAHAALRDHPTADKRLAQLVEPAWAILQDLLSIGSRRNSWNCFHVLFDAIEASDAHEELRPQVVERFTAMIRTHPDASDREMLEVLLKMCEWTRRYASDDFPELVKFIPQFLSSNLERVETGAAMQAYLYARHVCVGFDEGTQQALVLRLIEEGVRGTEARSVFHEYLSSSMTERSQLEAGFERLAYVNPDPELAADADLEALNGLLSEYYPECEWVWRNRALMFRRRSDSVGAMACLARAMNISGEPPELMGLLSPVIAGMGFLGSAYQFARFVTPEMRDRFHLGVLDLAVAEPGTESGSRKLLGRLEGAEAIQDLPPEFRPHIRRRRADLLFGLGEYRAAGRLYADLLRDDLSDELAAVRLADVSFRFGDRRRAENYLRARFTARVAPLVAHLRSRMAEEEGDLETAVTENRAAMACLPEAQDSGREHKEKALGVIQDRIVRMMGPTYADCALLAMLQMETHVPRHRDLELLEPVLEQREITLCMKSGDVEAARHVVKRIVERGPADLEVFIAGTRASLGAGRLEEAAEFLDRAEEEGRGDSAELFFLRGLIFARKGEREEAETWIRKAMDRVPTAEGRLALAALRVDDGRESEALEILLDLREEEGGTSAIRARLLELRGRLLERAGRRDEARESYIEAVDADGSWTEARRRAGLLLVEDGLDDAGQATDEETLRRGLAYLEGYNDSHAVIHEALARAALEESPRRAASLLETHLKRTAGDAWRCLQLARLRYLVASGDHALAHETLLAIAEEGPVSKGLRKKINRCLAGVKRRLALERLGRSSGIDEKAIKSVLADLQAAEDLAPSEKFKTVVRIIGRAAGRTAEPVKTARNSPDALVLASALAEGTFPPTDAIASRVASICEKHAEGSMAVIAGLLSAIYPANRSAANLLGAIDAVEASEASLPHPRLALLRLAATKALSAESNEGLDQVLDLAPGQLEDFRLYRRLLDVVDAPPDEERTAGVLGILGELENYMPSDPPRDDALSDRLATIRSHITALKETPSPAWASARLRAAGKRARVFEPAVLRFWEEQLDDPEMGAEAHHHVALLRLSAAHEAEAAGGGAEDQWKAAHQAWADFIRHDEAWEALARVVGSSLGMSMTEDVQGVRKHIAEWILRAQMTLAKKRLFANDVPAGISHGRVVSTSPLLELTSIEKIRKDLFSALTADLQRFVQKGDFEEALRCIDRAIVADPDNQAAYREVARVSALALEPELGRHRIDRISKDRSRVDSTCESLGKILMTADGPLRELTAGDDFNREVAEDLGVCLRAMAFVAFFRDHTAADACALLDRGIEIQESCGVHDPELRRFRSHLGLEVVARTMETSGEDAPIHQANPVDQALAEVERLLALDPSNVHVLAQKCKLLLVSDRDEEAESLARELFKSAQFDSEPSAVRAAVELLHQVQTERERLRYESKMDMVRQLIRQRNWRAARELFCEAIVGRENDPEHLVLHADILIGLHKVDRAEKAVDELSDCAELQDVWQNRRARLASLKYFCAMGGDISSAFDLWERGKVEQALSLSRELIDADGKDAAAQFLAARCLLELGDTERAAGHVQAARRNARKAELFWIEPLLNDEDSA